MATATVTQLAREVGFFVGANRVVEHAMRVDGTEFMIVDCVTSVVVISENFRAERRYTHAATYTIDVLHYGIDMFDAWGMTMPSGRATHIAFADFATVVDTVIRNFGVKR